MLVVATGGPLMLLGISPPSQEKNRERGGGRGMDGGKGGYWSAVEALKQRNQSHYIVGSKQGRLLSEMRLSTSPWMPKIKQMRNKGGSPLFRPHGCSGVNFCCLGALGALRWLPRCLLLCSFFSLPSPSLSILLSRRRVEPWKPPQPQWPTAGLSLSFFFLFSYSSFLSFILAPFLLVFQIECPNYTSRLRDSSVCPESPGLG